MSAARGAALIQEVTRRWLACQKTPQIMTELGISRATMQVVMDFYTIDAWPASTPPSAPTRRRRTGKDTVDHDTKG